MTEFYLRKCLVLCEYKKIIKLKNIQNAFAVLFRSRRAMVKAFINGTKFSYCQFISRCRLRLKSESEF